jgi:NADPH2:quinone reductase
MVRMDGYGGPEVLVWREVPARALRHGEVRIQTMAAAVNRADIEIRRGHWPIEQPEPFPYTPGLEVLGKIIEVADGVQSVRVGDRVITMMQRLGGIHGERPGGYAEEVTVLASSVAQVPADVDYYALAALGLAAVTAWEGLRRLQLQPGHRIAVLGASGGVGSAAISLANGLSAQVLAVLPRAGKEHYVRSLGADEVLSLQAGSLVDQVGPRRLDAVLELLGQRTFRDSVAVLAPGGRLCLVGALTGEDLHLVAWDLMQDLVVTGYSSENLTGDELRADIAHLVGELRAGRLAIPRYQLLPLREAGQAHRLMETGGVEGRLLLVP